MQAIRIFILLIPWLSASIIAGFTQNLPKKTVNGNSSFAFQLFDQIKTENQNVFFSPYSISSALAMTYTGAEGITEKEMQSVLGFHEDKSTLAADYYRLNQRLDTLDKGKNDLSVANSLWCQKGYHFLDRFLDINTKFYNAGIKKVDFKRKYPRVRKRINQWVEQQTHHKIQDLIGEGMLTPMTRLVLANAIYFKGMWEHPFDKGDTRSNFFYADGKRKVPVQLMHRSLSARYYEDELVQVLELPYSGEELSMMILLPQQIHGIDNLEKKLNDTLYDKYLESMYTKEVELWIPKFKAETQYNLNAPLEKLGMPSAFGKDADFSGMTGGKELFISDAVHKAFVEVNEEGTEAAAATGIVMSKTALVKKPQFKANHPFIYLIKDNQTHTILFMGRLSHPKH